ncbi:MAG: cyclic pyranopterin monophosphate synthase MoaC [Opitutae bacterium]|jgi:cyclic pyranopterin monophosphate synthase|nr:cyclic pyranopterin monophosphate synthase MoaC [Opitutae bacterium]
MPCSEFTHLDENSSPQMVDVGSKESTERRALARTIVEFPQEVAEELDCVGMRSSKGSIYDVAIIAGTQAAKKTADLIPLCHFIPLDSVKIKLSREGDRRILVECRVKATHKTGVEMEALVGCSVAALTVYDMCKALSHEIVIGETKLIEKTGGKSKYFLEEIKA